MRRKRIWRSGVARNLTREIGATDAGVAAAKLAGITRGDRDPARAVPVEELAHAHGVVVRRGPIRVSALLEEGAEGWVATINSADPPTRQRFSLAHELGHLAIYRSTKLRGALNHDACKTTHQSEAQEVERLCDIFAAELLMPLEAWRQHLFKWGISLSEMKRLLRKYKVSFEAAALRVAEADLWRCAVIRWGAIYEKGKVAELRPEQAWSNIGISRDDVGRLPNDGRYDSGGSPLAALSRKQRVSGLVPIVINGEGCTYAGESEPFRGRKDSVITLLVAEPMAGAIMRRSERPRL